jgi:hypothetical protein
MWEIARPLGLARMTGQDGAAVLGTELFDQLDRARLQRPNAEITVGELRAALDHPQRRGLIRDMQDLIILLYADRMKVRMVRYGTAVNDAQIGRLDDDVVLRQMPLPADAQWRAAVQVMNLVFGCGLSAALTVNGFGRLNNEVERVRAERGAAVRELVDAMGLADVSARCGPEASRRRTAETAKRIIEAMAAGDEVVRVGKIAAFADERLEAVGRSVAKASDIARVLRTTNWPVFKMIEQLADKRRDAAAVILGRVGSILAADESDAPLSDALAEATRQANDLMLQGAVVTPPTPPSSLPPAPQPQPPAPSGGEGKGPEQTPGSSPKLVRRGALTGAKAAETRQSVDELLALLAQKPTVKVNLSWEVVEE